jgi:hypothetical protein
MEQPHKGVSDRAACRASVNRPAQQGQSDAFTAVVELLADRGCLDAVDFVCLGSCSRSHRIAAEAVLGSQQIFCCSQLCSRQQLLSSPSTALIRRSQPELWRS